MQWNNHGAFQDDICVAVSQTSGFLRLPSQIRSKTFRYLTPQDEEEVEIRVERSDNATFTTMGFVMHPFHQQEPRNARMLRFCR